MGIVRGLVSRLRRRKQEEDSANLSRVIGSLLESTAYEVFCKHRDKLLESPITYVIPGVWGAKLGGELDETQKAIQSRIAPVVDEVQQLFHAQGMTKAQRDAIQYLIRGYMVTYITYMIEAFRNCTSRVAGPPCQKASILEHMEPVGKA